MTKSRFFATLRHSAARLALVALTATLATACDSFVYDDEGDCQVTYKLKFVYDYNMKRADAFAHEVKSVRVYAFDEANNLVWTGIESGEALKDDGFCMTLPLNPGKYRLQAWCGADNNPGDEHFVIAEGIERVTSPEQSTCTLVKERQADGSAHSSKNLHPLFHGVLDVDLQDHTFDGGEYVYTMPLVKDTNKIKIILQHLSGEDLDINDFEFRITDANGLMAHDNSLLDDEIVTYHPWAKYSGVAGVEVKNADSRAITQVAVAQAEITTPRLMADHASDMNLTITRYDGTQVLSIPPIDYALMVKSLEYEGKISNQEYLDRQDEYSMVFFLDANYKWVDACIIVNSWRIVLNNSTLGN